MKLLDVMEVPAADWYEKYGKESLIAALAMSLIALLLVLNRYWRGYAKPKRAEQPADFVLTDQMMQQILTRIAQEKNAFQPGAIQAPSLNDSFRPKPDVVDIPEQPKVPAIVEEGPVTVELSPSNTQAAMAPPVNPVKRLFAKFSADEHRFSGEMLVETQDGEQVYELEINGDTGTYRVSENEAVQKYALSEDKYLLACAYEEIPTNRNVRIINDGTGRLSRSGNDWHIDQKVLINFA